MFFFSRVVGTAYKGSYWFCSVSVASPRGGSANSLQVHVLNVFFAGMGGCAKRFKNGLKRLLFFTCRFALVVTCALHMLFRDCYFAFRVLLFMLCNCCCAINVLQMWLFICYFVFVLYSCRFAIKFCNCRFANPRRPNSCKSPRRANSSTKVQDALTVVKAQEVLTVVKVQEVLTRVKTKTGLPAYVSACPYPPVCLVWLTL